MSLLQQNLISIRERIAGAAGRAKRDPSEVKLVAVSKTYPVPVLREAIEDRKSVV